MFISIFLSGNWVTIFFRWYCMYSNILHFLSLVLIIDECNFLTKDVLVLIVLFIYTLALQSQKMWERLVSISPWHQFLYRKPEGKMKWFLLVHVIYWESSCNPEGTSVQVCVSYCSGWSDFRCKVWLVISGDMAISILLKEITQFPPSFPQMCEKELLQSVLYSSNLTYIISRSQRGWMGYCILSYIVRISWFYLSNFFLVQDQLSFSDSLSSFLKIKRVFYLFFLKQQCFGCLSVWDGLHLFQSHNEWHTLQFSQVL